MELRKLFAALVAALPLAALAQAAAAPAPLVTVYGTLNVNTQYVEAKDATAGDAADVSGRVGVSIDSSNIGVRGGLDVAHGLKVVYQCETQASFDGLDTRALCNRNSRLGLQSGFGTLFWGNWDTPYKAAAYGTKADDPFGNTDVFGYQNIFGSAGYGIRSTAFTGAANAGFDMRAANSIAYWSPKFGPVSFKVQYGTNEERSADGVVDPQLLSAVVNVDIAGLSLAAATEYHEDLYGIRTLSRSAAFGGTAAERALRNAGNGAAKDIGLKLAAGYELPLPVGALTVMGMVEQLMYQQDAATDGFEDYDRFAWLVGAKFRLANHEFRARFSQALDPSFTAVGPLAGASEDDLGAQNYALGYAYHLAKSTQLYAFYSQILNDDRAQYTFTVGGPANVVGTNTPVGSNPLAIGVGMRYAF